MTLHEIQHILETEIGFDPARVSYTALESIVQKRLQTLNIDEVSEYSKRLKDDLSELQYLIENVVVPETWFFRHRKLFDKLMPEFDQLAQRYHTQGRIIRCLSLACSTGEEPYSLAMALADQSLPSGAFIIDAIDISHDALNKAKQAAYDQSSFRNDMPEPPARYFSVEGKKQKLREHISRSVHFRRLNVLDIRELKSLGKYDIIFCRNMLIYFSETRQRDVLLQIADNLTDSGILAVSAAEASLVTQHLHLTQLDASIPLFYTETSINKPLPVITPVREKPIPEKRPHQRAAPQTKHSKRSIPEKAFTENFSSKDISHAWLLTDQGHLKEARTLAEKMLNKQFSLPETLYLLAVIEMTYEEYALAEHHFRQHLVYQSDHLNALRYRQQALLELDRIEEANTCEMRIQRLTAQKRAEAS